MTRLERFFPVTLNIHSMFPESSSPVSPELPMTLKLTPILPLLPPLMPASSSALSPLVPVSPSAHPKSAPSGRSDLPRDVKSPALPWCEDVLSLPPVSESWTPPRSFDPLAPSWFLAPSSPLCPIIPLAPPCSTVPLDPPWSVVVHRSLRDSTPLALPSYSVLLALSGSDTNM